jgi:hypothetical protein
MRQTARYAADLRGQIFKQYGVFCERPMRRRALATVIS